MPEWVFHGNDELVFKSASNERLRTLIFLMNMSPVKRETGAPGNDAAPSGQSAAYSRRHFHPGRTLAICLIPGAPWKIFYESTEFEDSHGPAGRSMAKAGTIVERKRDRFQASRTQHSPVYRRIALVSFRWLHLDGSASQVWQMEHHFHTLETLE
jgi:hypothetical protein